MIKSYPQKWSLAVYEWFHLYALNGKKEFGGLDISDRYSDIVAYERW